MDRAFVIFGATGDLSLRMLLPSLYFLDLDSLLPADWRIVGVSRSQLSTDEFKLRDSELTLQPVQSIELERADDVHNGEFGRFGEDDRDTGNLRGV